MAEERVQRRLAAILAADVSGYSRLIGADEEGTLARLKTLRRDLRDPKVDEHRGRIVKTAGDGLLVEFSSVVDALRCAVEVHRGMVEHNGDVEREKRITLRIGINVGDIVVEGGDIYGDGVNVAARLEGLAEPGGICVSGRVQEDARGKLDLAFEDLGEHRLKNIAWPVKVYRAQLGGQVAAPRPALASPDKPSIAVLPFENLSGDPEQDYFADGVVEEIITALSRMRWLFVIARNSSFSYKGRAVDVKQIGRELGVRYLVEGSVRRSSSRVRITGQLIDASTGANLWADRFEGQLEDIFDLQDQITVSVVGAIAPKLEQAEIERSRRKPTDNLDAYDYFLRGMSAVHQWTKEANIEAIQMFAKATELDPNFASAYGMLSRCYSQRKAGGWVTDRARDIVETERVARRAAALGSDDAVALCTAGIGLAFVVGETDEGIALIDRSLMLNPNLAMAWLFSGWVNVWLGEPDLAIANLAHAMRLSPNDPQVAMMQASTACAHFVADRIAEATSWAERSVRLRPNYFVASCVLAASYALGGRLEEAAKAITRLRQIDPGFRISNLLDSFPIRRQEDFARWAEGLRKAGLPE
jgi:TolB-like protein